MGFYQELSRYYDEIFSTDAEELRFLKERLAGKKRLLDIGCGTGNKTELFSAPDNTITAIDLDPDMIARARAEHGQAGISYRVLDMSAIDLAFAPASFDGFLCLGNTLVHLGSSERIGQLLNKTYELLSDGGLGVIQILNYDRILDRQVDSLPVIETRRTRFYRTCARSGEQLRFITKLFLKETGETLENEIPLYPLRREQLCGLLRSAGFREVDFCGSYEGTPLEDDSFVVIAVCGK